MARFTHQFPSSVLLAGIAIRNNNDIPDDIEKMKIIDPACGNRNFVDGGWRKNKGSNGR